jgi:hypothetical protein
VSEGRVSEGRVSEGRVSEGRVSEGRVSEGRALLAAPAARQALADGRVGEVELALSRGAYVRLGRDWVMLAEPGAPFGPLSLVVGGLEQFELSPGLPARVSGARLVLGEHSVSLERVRDRGMSPIGVIKPAGRPAMAAAAAAALAALPSAPALLRPGIASLAGGRVREAVRALAGLGAGLTPAGDDVLAGYAASRSMLRGLGGDDAIAPDHSARISSLAGARSSELGLAYLRCAEQGELPEPGARLLAAIRTGSAAAAGDATEGLSAWGASSGIALGWGITAALGAGQRYRHRVAIS